ncbi:MAG: hypothetical protein M1834_002708 [Cirrosporium novae-zelandiae]|nr:MAG: hypothetical protein M1834_002708 [Cirrosporium novae-zelandiae]
MEKRLATIGIMSIGDMGMGIAKLLKANSYHVVTVASNRSQATRTRIQEAEVENLSSDEQIYCHSDYIFSIAPPRDARSIAERVLKASKSTNVNRNGQLYYVDFNAISPQSTLELSRLFESNPQISFLDGGIIGGPPTLIGPTEWKKPSLVVSGPRIFQDNTAPSGSNLAETLNIRHINDSIGSASGLKMCFASIIKGLTALATESFTTASRLGVLDQLRTHLKEFNPKIGELAERGLVGMPPKAYRWVREMEEIGDTMAEQGGFSSDLFKAIAEVYRIVAEDTELGKEQTGARVRGKTPEDAALLISDGLSKKKVEEKKG